MDNLSVEMLAAAIIAIILEFFPLLNEKWAGLSKKKRTFFTGLINALLAISVVVFNCYGGGSGVCPESLINEILKNFVFIFAINQASYSIIAKPNSPRKQ